MSSKGLVTTARGEVLNLDDLIFKAKRPAGEAEDDHSTRERASYTPVQENKPRLRGFVPSRGSSVPPVTEEPKVETKPSKSKAGGKSLAEMTAIKVEKKVKPAEAKAEAKNDEDDETLGSIMSEIDSKGTKGKKS